MLSVGHDEYWSWGMRDAVEGFIERGGNVAFFSGNTVYWQVRYEDDGQTMVCHKYAARQNDPVAATDRRHLLTSIWSDPLIGRPENHLTGLSFCRGGYARFGSAVPGGASAYTICRPDHWAFAGTGLRYGDALGLAERIVGYEVDGCDFTLADGLPVPTGRDGTPADLTILATAPAHLVSNSPGNNEGVIPLSFDTDATGRPRIHGDDPPRRRVRREHAPLGARPCGHGRLPARRHGVQRRRHRLGLRAGQRSSRPAGHAECPDAARVVRAGTVATTPVVAAVCPHWATPITCVARASRK